MARWPSSTLRLCVASTLGLRIAGPTGALGHPARPFLVVTVVAAAFVGGVALYRRR